MITFRQKGNLRKFQSFSERLLEIVKLGRLDKYGRIGVDALSSATPVDSGETASSWYYKISRARNRVSLSFHNDNMAGDAPVAIILQYGHATRNGGWVEGRDYINPAIQPVFDKIINDIWTEVTSDAFNDRR